MQRPSFPFSLVLLGPSSSGFSRTRCLEQARADAGLARRSLLFAAALALAGCQGSSSTSSPAESAGAGAAAEQQLTTKLNIYVACLNHVNPAVRYSRERYLGWAARDKGPVLGSAGQGVIEVSRETTYGYECFKRDGGLASALQSAPKLVEIDAAGAAYQKAIDGVMEVTKKAAAYYEHGDYKDDQLAQGKALHKPLLDGFDGFDAASHQLSAALDKLQDELAVKDLATLEKTEGKKARWHQRSLMRAAGLMVRELGAADPMELAKVTPAITSFTSAFADLQAWTAGNQAESDKVVSWSSFIGYADDLATEIKELGRGFRDHHKAPESGAGSMEQIISKFNRLVDSSNGLWN